MPWGDSAALAGALGELIGNDDLRQRLGSAGRLRMRRFSPEKERQDWEGVYKGFMGF